MYEVKILPPAHKDMQDITDYIAGELGNPDAALDWLDAVEGAIAVLARFPYAHPLHTLPFTLPSETRFFSVGNYLVFYVVAEPEGVVEIRRIVYGRMDLRGVFL